MKRLLVTLLLCPVLGFGQANINEWILNLNGKHGSYWANTATSGPPVYVFTVSADSADILKLCYSADSIWVRAQGLTNDMGQYLNPGYCYAQNYVYRFPRNPSVAATKVVSPKIGAIGALLNGVPIYGLSNAKSWDGTTNTMAPGGLGIWNVEVGLSEGFVLDTAFGAHPQQSGAYHSHTTPYRLYKHTPSNHHSPIVGFAFDGYPVYGPYGYSIASDSTSPVTRMKTGYSLRSITTRHTLPDGTSLTAAQYGPDVSTTYPIGFYCEDYEWLSANGGDLDQYNGRFCVTPEYPSGTYAYFVTIDATGAAAFPYYIGIDYYGAPDQGNFGMTPLHMPASAPSCIFPLTNAVDDPVKDGSRFSMYPNPAHNDILLVTANGAFTDVLIYNQLGAVVLAKAINGEKTSLAVDLSAGMYFVKCRNKNTGATEVQKLVMQ